MALTSNTRGMIGKGTIRLRRRDGTEEPFERFIPASAGNTR